MFAGSVEMHLQQFIGGVAELQRAALGEVELNRVAVVDDGVGGLAPGQFQRRQLRFDGGADIDRRLLRADRAGLVGGVEVAPTGRARRALITPMSAFGGKAGTGADRANRQSGHCLQ
jgi:hypothetical protein